MNHDTVFSLDDALARLDDDRETFLMIAELFVDQGPKDLADMQAALAAHDAAAIARVAHRLKGAILQFCAPSALAATKELEELGKAGNLESAAVVCAALDTELRRLLAVLRQLLEKGLPA